MTLKDIEFYKLSSEELIEVVNDYNYSLSDRCKAIFYIKCPNLLKDIAKSSSNRSILKTVFEYIPNEKDLFVDFSSNHPDWQIRLISINHILNDYFFKKDCDLILESEEYDEYIAKPNPADIASGDEDYKNRLVATLFIEDNSILNNIALNDENNHVRIAAISRINDDDQLIEIIRQNKDENVIKFASSKIPDDSKLIEIYNSIKTPGHERGIISNIYNQSFLIDEVYKNRYDWTLCDIAVSNIYSQKTLHEIVKHYAHPDFDEPDRELYFPDDYTYLIEFINYTISLIVDDELLTDLAFNSHKDYDLYHHAAMNILNPSILADIVLKYPINMESLRSFINITDEDKLFEIALNHPIDETRSYAASHIFDKDKLRKIIDNESNEEVIKEAFDNLKLENEDFTLDNDTTKIFVNVLKTINDDSKLLEIFHKYRNPIIKQVACETIGDEEMLRDIALKNYIIPSCFAINNISDDSLILDIALNACFEKTRVYAISKINDNEMLKHIYKNSSSDVCKTNALSRIKDE